MSAGRYFDSPCHQSHCFLFSLSVGDLFISVGASLSGSPPPSSLSRALSSSLFFFLSVSPLCRAHEWGINLLLSFWVLFEYAVSTASVLYDFIRLFFLWPSCRVANSSLYFDDGSCAFLILTLPIPSHRHPLFLPFCREYFLPVHCSLLRTTTSASIYPSCICIPSQSKAHLMTSANTGPIKGSRRPSDRSVLPYQGCQGEPRLERVEIVIAISKVVGLQEDKIRLSQRLKFIEVFLFIYSTTWRGLR